VAKSYISKVVLVGGPSQIPFLRERIKNELNIEVDSSMDPLTSVARGACIYGLGCRVPSEIVDKHKDEEDAEKVDVSLNYESMTSD
jgi:molecular chaperone DnaK